MDIPPPKVWAERLDPNLTKSLDLNVNSGNTVDTGTFSAAPRRCDHKIQTVGNYRLNGLGPPQVNCSENKEMEREPVDSKRLKRHNDNNTERDKA